MTGERVAFGLGCILSTNPFDLTIACDGVRNHLGIALPRAEAIAVLTINGAHIVLSAEAVATLRDALCLIVLPGEDEKEVLP